MTTLTVVGSGDAFNARGRRHSCYLLQCDGGGPLMIDFGATALYGLRNIGVRASRVAGFAFTHLHGDHAGGWPFLIIDAMFNDPRTALLDVVGPIGTEAKLNTLCDVMYGDVMDRDKPFEVKVREIAAGQGADHVGFHIEGFRAEHMDPPEQPLCLRITAPDGKVIAFSGDTAMGDGLKAAADGADLLVAECSCMAPPCGRHITWQEWEQAFDEVKAKRILLTHFGESMRDNMDALSPPDHVSFADDGLVLTV